MASSAVIVSTPKADFSGAKTAANLPIRPEGEMAGAEDLLVHFKIASRDPETVRRAMRVVEAQLAGQRVGSRAIAVMTTGEDVEMSATDKQKIAAMIAPMVANALGVTLREPYI